MNSISFPSSEKIKALAAIDRYIVTAECIKKNSVVQEVVELLGLEDFKTQALFYRDACKWLHEKLTNENQQGGCISEARSLVDSLVSFFEFLYTDPYLQAEIERAIVEQYGHDEGELFLIAKRFDLMTQVLAVEMELKALDQAKEKRAA